MIIADSSQPVLAPAVGAGTSVVMGEIFPCVAVFAVVLAHGPPLPLTQIGAPLFPRYSRLAAFAQACALCIGRFGSVPTVFGRLPCPTCGGHILVHYHRHQKFCTVT